MSKIDADLEQIAELAQLGAIPERPASSVGMSTASRKTNQTREEPCVLY